MSSEDDSPSVGDFFVNRDYKTKPFTFLPPPQCKYGEAPLTFSVDTLEAASTDFDMTGQIVWSVSVLVSQYLCFVARDEVQGAEAILELGAGCGLCGLACSALGGRAITLTDNEPEVLRVLERSAAYTPHTTVCDLDWGNEGSHGRLETSTGRRTWPLILGADVIYWSHAVPLLFETVAKLLAPGGVFILGFTNRRNGLKEAAEAAADGAGLTFETVDPKGFFPVPTPDVFTAQLPLVTLYRMKHK